MTMAGMGAPPVPGAVDMVSVDGMRAMLRTVGAVLSTIAAVMPSGAAQTLLASSGAALIALTLPGPGQSNN